MPSIGFSGIITQLMCCHTWHLASSHCIKMRKVEVLKLSNVSNMHEVLMKITRDHKKMDTVVRWLLSIKKYVCTIACNFMDHREGRNILNVSP